MSGIDKTIERVKGADFGSTGDIWWNDEIKAIISDWERLKAELEKEQYDHRVRRCAHKADNKTYKAELSKAQHQIRRLDLLVRLPKVIKMNDEKIAKYIKELEESCKVDPKLLDEPADI